MTPQQKRGNDQDLDIDAIKARLARVPAFGAVRPAVTDEVYCPLAALMDPDDKHATILYAPATCDWEVPDVLTFVAHAPADIAALIAEVERLLALVPAPPKTLPPGEVRRHSGTKCIDGTDFVMDIAQVGGHQIVSYYPSDNAHLRDRCGYAPHPIIWVDGAIYWEDGLIATAQEEDFCADVEDALVRYILEHGNLPDDFGDLGLDTFGRDVGIEVSND